MTALVRTDFDAFMQEVTGYLPFPWQRRLLECVLDRGWPELLDLPTGTGKTSVLLIALFVLAIDPQDSPRRIAVVVDRRIIVDQVDGFVRKIAAALKDPKRPVSSKVAMQLRALTSSNEGEPVRVVHLRGGVPRDDSWLSTPDQPTIFSSTVDQVGSRLLFRGYGVTPCMRPVHAGILSRDTLYFLDEVHLATAFEETLSRLQGTYASWPELSGETGRRFQVVRMSATVPTSSADRRAFGLGDDDKAHPVLARRLNVSRRAALQVVKTKKTSTPEGRRQNRKVIARAACGLAQTAAKGGARAVGIVVNRVDTARRIAASLAKLHGDTSILLITGRMRPYERTEIQVRLEQSAGAGSERPDEGPPTFVVATSCIEAGADLDFDALITEAASLDALRQRFGRLNRLGNHSQAPAWILAAKDQLGSNAQPDPVYGGALKATWEYLNEIAEKDGKQSFVDFGLNHFVKPEPARRAKLLPPVAEAPVLFPNYLDMWSETRPAPHPDPEPALWLHGKDRPAERDISVIFRAGVPRCNTRNIDRLDEALEFLRPISEEAVSVPLSEFRKWMESSKSVWVWRGHGVEVVALATLQIGDTVIVDTGHGGLGAGTWNPEAKTPVEDVAERAAFRIKGSVALRLSPRTLPEELREGLPRPVITDDPDEMAAQEELCLAWIDDLGRHLGTVPEDWHDVLRAVSDPKAKRILSIAQVDAESSPEGTPAKSETIWQVAIVPSKHAIEATTEDDVSVFSGLPVSLASHLEDVKTWAAQYAYAAGIGTALSRDIALAALLHDIGKADRRFQALLRGGDPVQAAGAPIAKSRSRGSTQRSRARAATRSGWPAGFRHELVSLALFDASPELQAQAHDVELVRHLIASHHGWCRPWPPALIDPEPEAVTIEVAGIRAEATTASVDDNFLNECASRFRRLTRRYGWHGLAYLEALLRLGDHQASRTPGARPGT